MNTPSEQQDQSPVPRSPALLEGLVSLVIPAHNEADNIGPVILAADSALRGMASEHEILLVDDGSTDGTPEVARAALGSEDGRLRIISHARKSGYGVSVRDGLLAAKGDFVGFMDGDAQFDPGDLAALAEFLPQADLVAGVRKRRADPWHRLVVSGVFNALVRLLYGIAYRDVDCGLKLMRRSALESVQPIQATSALLNTELYFKIAHNGGRIVQVTVDHHPRRAGVRSGGRLRPILRAIRELVLLRIRLARTWNPAADGPAATGPGSSSAGQTEANAPTEHA